MNQSARAGFTYTVEHLSADGEVKHSETFHNLMPYQGLNHLLDVGLRGGAQNSQWYIGIYEASYAPEAGDVAASFAATAGEITAYNGATRQQLYLAAPVNGAADNTALRAEFAMTSAKTVRGAFIVSSPTKGGTDGVLVSAAQFPSPKPVQQGDVLRLTAGFNFISI